MGVILLKMEELESRVGQEIAVSPWTDVSQDRIDRFADATSIGQWIHSDAEAARPGPFGTAVADGFLVLSLVAPLASESYRVEDSAARINLGCDEVRFEGPVPSGSRVRARFRVDGVEKLPRGALKVTWGVSFEREGADEPCVVAKVLARYSA